MNNQKTISNSIRTLIIATTLSPTFASCTSRDSRFVESDNADSIIVINWNSEFHDNNGNKTSNTQPRNIYSDDNDIVDRINEGRSSGYCTYDDYDPEETEDINFYDANSHFSNGGEVSDEERDEIDGQYEE
jgi:hypothetical protein